jgi:hypothetical protein
MILFMKEHVESREWSIGNYNTALIATGAEVDNDSYLVLTTVQAISQLDFIESCWYLVLTNSTKELSCSIILQNNTVPQKNYLGS